MTHVRDKIHKESGSVPGIYQAPNIWIEKKYTEGKVHYLKISTLQLVSYNLKGL